MKNKFLIATLFLLSITIFTSDIQAQTITVTPSKTVYRRPKPLNEYKKTFTVTRPIIKGVPAPVKKKIEANVSYEKHFEFNVQEEIKEIQWVEEASYTLDYNKRGLLGFTLTIEGSGAYPDGSNKSVVIDVKTGNRVAPAAVFTDLAGLAAKLKTMQHEEVKKALVDIKKEDPEANTEDLFSSTDFTAENLTEFSISDKGITFLYDYGFPHVIKAWEPEGMYTMTWAQLKPFIKSDGLFGQFVR